MDVVAATPAPDEPGAVHVHGWLDGTDPAWGLPAELAGALAGLPSLVAADPAVAVLHDGRAHVLVRLADGAEVTSEDARIAAGRAVAAARTLGATTLVWRGCERYAPAQLRGLVEGTGLAAYAFERYRSGPPRPRIGRLVLAGCELESATLARWTVPVTAQNAARDLQNLPPNELDPPRLADHARSLAEGLPLAVDVLDGAAVDALGMGALSAVGRGSAVDPHVIVLRYAGGAPDAGTCALVGKAVTFDSGGLSLKSPDEMIPMKYDMSGGAAVLETLTAVAQLGLPVNAIGVIGATENMPGGVAYRPGDVVRTLAGLTVEINDTDSEGRLVLADCLAYARTLGATSIVDVGTLTGAIGRALGDRHGGLFSNSDALAERLLAAGRATGELLWRMPLHPDSARWTDGRVADLANKDANRDAGGGAIFCAQFLERFAGDREWAHLDISNTAYDVGRPYHDARGGNGFGVRLLVELLSGGDDDR
jgi:leucyl aminopeptidase